jgi:proteasome-associated ATPase
MRGFSSDTSDHVDRFLVNQLDVLGSGLNEVLEKQEELKAVVDKVMTPPWYPAVFLGTTLTENGEVALVAQGNLRSLVKFGPGVDSASVRCGDEVLLSGERNFVIATPLYPLMLSGETAAFDRYTSEGRLVLNLREEEFVVTAADSLSQIELRRGDQVRWNRSSLLAIEKIEGKEPEDMFLEETPKESFAQVGGLDNQIEALQRAIRLHWQHPEIAKRYQLRRKGSVLLVGPPGTGKTMVARALANWLGELSPTGRSRFIYVKPGGLHSMWFGQSEANYREFFHLARKAGDAEPDVPVVMFFDEVDAIGAARGATLNRVDDKVLTAFMTELDGLESRGNILVVAATNRRDALDPALLRPGRLGDLVLEVPRPDLRAARDILGKHLSRELPFAAESGEIQTRMREEVIDALTTTVFAPNGLGAMATITFRDGTQRKVEPSDLISGAMLAKVAAEARERAARRTIETGADGILLEDLVVALTDELRQFAENLTPVNCQQHLNGLPNHLDVVRVEPIRRRAVTAVRYLNAA